MSPRRYCVYRNGWVQRPLFPQEESFTASVLLTYVYSAVPEPSAYGVFAGLAAVTCLACSRRAPRPRLA
jgi:hypothetical protein